MNDRIKELADDANKFAITEYNKQTMATFYTNKSVEEFFNQKFAELIVEECVTTLEQHHPFTKDPEAYLYAISLIEEHFGVEE